MGKEEQPGCLLAILRLFTGGKREEAPAEKLPYETQKAFLTPAERSFFGVLQVAVADSLLILAKVRIADILSIRRSTEKRQSHLNRITSKHVDFVLCSADTVEPLLVIELDDCSHSSKSAQEKDAFKNEAFAAAGLPLLRVPVKRAYNVEELVTQIEAAVNGGDEAYPESNSVV